MEIYKNLPAITAVDIEAWRAWLKENHQSSGVWLIIYRKDSNKPSIYYPEAVDEALCFGWIDSKPNKRDTQSYYQYFSPRNPKSNWSRVNKEKIARLAQENRLQPSGWRLIELAKATGTWNALDDVENLIVPDDLQTAFDNNAQAWKYWQDFPPSVRRGILEWIFNAKRKTTRQKRIEETVRLAQKNIRANQYRS
jgi:uncharacterized protein YdeI (YjbR/CyaY-like superfamily)